MTDEKDINALRHYVARLEDDLASADLEIEGLRKYSSRQALDIVTLGQEVGRLRKALDEQRYAGIDEGFRCAITALDWISLEREKSGTADEFRLVEKCIKSLVNAQERVRREARAALAEKEEK